MDYVKYCKQLNFEQRLDYEYLRNLFKSILSRLNTIYDLKFTWNLKKYAKVINGESTKKTISCDSTFFRKR